MLGSASAQKHKLDSTGAAYHGNTQYGYWDGMNPSMHFGEKKDTGLTMIQNYDKTYLANLGSVGMPAIPLFFNLRPEPGFQFGLNQWDAYRYTRYNVPYFNTQNPYTDLYYAQGPVLFQMLRGTHTQNIKPNWNYAFTFEKMSNSGFYSNQKNVHNNLGVTTWYHSLNQRYQLMGSFIFNGFQQQENGGISDLNYYLGASLAARTRAPVHLNTAGQKWREVDYNLSQYYFIGSKAEYKSTDTGKAASYIKPRLYISHTLNIHRTRYTFTSGAEDLEYFDTTYYSTKGTNDSLWQRRISNEISLGILGLNKLDTTLHASGFNYGLQARIYGRYEYEQFRQTMQDTIVNNTIAGAEIKMQLAGDFDARAEYYLWGYNSGDYLLDAIWLSPEAVKKGLRFFAEGRLQQFEQGYFQEKAYVNHFRWDNDFSKSGLLNLKGGMSIPGIPGYRPLMLSTDYIAYANPIYYDSAWQARQSMQTQHYVHVQLNSYQRFKKIYLTTELHYQRVLQGNVIRVPSFVGRASLFLQGYLFHHAMEGRIGADISYNSYWLAPGYIPGLSGFALQDTFKAGNYPVLDFWISARVKSFQMFAKLEHLNQGLTGDNYFMVPYYPMQPRTFRFGVKWTFYN
jgi:hypothetical protein